MSANRPVGRPRKGGELLSVERPVKFAPSVYEKLQEVSAKDGVSIAEKIRRAVHADLFPPEESPDEQGTPILGPIPAGGLADQEEYVEQRLYCNKHPKGPEYAYVHVKGDSMNKVVPDGAYALVKDRWAMSGEVIAVQFQMPDGSVQVTLKRLRVGSGGEVFLEPDSYNPEHKTIVMSPEKPEKKNICWVSPEMAAIKGVFTGDYVVASEK